MLLLTLVFFLIRREGVSSMISLLSRSSSLLSIGDGFSGKCELSSELGEDKPEEEESEEDESEEELEELLDDDLDFLHGGVGDLDFLNDGDLDVLRDDVDFLHGELETLSSCVMCWTLSSVPLSRL